MSPNLSEEEARNYLVRYHLSPTDVPGVFDRLGSVQYDPLKPAGSNPDLVLQARVPDYRVDDWQRYAYGDRLAYDAWDKQACLVPISDWAKRAITRTHYHAWHDSQVLNEHPEAVTAALEEIDSRGPLSSLEFSDRTSISGRHSWYGPTRIKRILRALWIRGVLVTHHRDGTRHYYERPERVIPEPHLSDTVLDLDAYHRWVVFRRYRAVGLLRPTAEAAVWSVCGPAPVRSQVLAGLVEEGNLLPVTIGARRTTYYMPADALTLLEGPPPERRMVFLAPLDNMLWDRKTISAIFGFDYVWEVYKPEAQRRWGYYVLPVLYGNRFVARIESRLEGKRWVVLRWWWEDGVERGMDVLDALKATSRRFRLYLGAEDTEVRDPFLDAATKDALT